MKFKFHDSNEYERSQIPEEQRLKRHDWYKDQHEAQLDRLEKRASQKNFSRIWRKLTPMQIVLISFLLIDLIGMFLLCTPLTSEEHLWTNPVDALFTSTSAVCVTGLVVKDTGTYWNLFGQIVIIILIQIGGLGFMTVMTLFFLATKKRVSLHDRQVLQSTVNADGISGIIQFIKLVLSYAFGIELIGGILLSFVFVPQFGWIKGIYYGIWHAVSMYCNAGFDLMGNYDSFVSYVTNPLLNFTVCALIIIGGLGFAVYRDLQEYTRKKVDILRTHQGSLRANRISSLSLNTKIVLLTTVLLLVGGTILYACFEWNNPGTLGNLQTGDKIMAAFFQAVTPRTAGANTIDQASLTNQSLLLTNILMFIGGSPGSTAGGIKTTCVAVILITLWSILMGKKRVNCLHREIPYMTIRRAMCVFAIGIILVVFEYFILLIQQPEIRPDYLLYEVFSAFDTVGLTCGITRDLTTVSKLALTVAMFIGRVGPMTIASVITSTEKRERESEGHYKLPDGNILIG